MSDVTQISDEQGVSGINLAQINKLVFEISCLQEMIKQRLTPTNRHNQVHNQPPLDG